MTNLNLVKKWSGPRNIEKLVGVGRKDMEVFLVLRGWKKSKGGHWIDPTRTYGWPDLIWAYLDETRED